MKPISFSIVFTFILASACAFAQTTSTTTALPTTTATTAVAGNYVDLSSPQSIGTTATGGHVYAQLVSSIGDMDSYCQKNNCCGQQGSTFCLIVNSSPGNYISELYSCNAPLNFFQSAWKDVLNLFGSGSATYNMKSAPVVSASNSESAAMGSCTTSSNATSTYPSAPAYASQTPGILPPATSAIQAPAAAAPSAGTDNGEPRSGESRK